MRTATMRLGDRTFVPKACEWCGSTDISYEAIGPHIQAKCCNPECGRKWFVKQIDEAEWARLVKERAGYRCERCGKSVQGRGAHAHHLRPQWFMPDYSLDVNNGICLCTECHKQIHGGCGTIREEAE